MLTTGWNLVSIPKPVGDSSVSSVFSGVTTVDKIYGRSGDTWQIASYSEGAWGGTLTDIMPGSGYWMQASADTTVNLIYKPADPLDLPPVYGLPAGWSLIGYTTLELNPSAPVSSYLLSVQGKWTSLYAFNPTTGWALSKPGAVGFSHVQMFKGYWLFLTEAGELVP
jgi:hypothetical protein